MHDRLSGRFRHARRGPPNLPNLWQRLIMGRKSCQVMFGIVGYSGQGESLLNSSEPVDSRRADGKDARCRNWLQTDLRPSRSCANIVRRVLMTKVTQTQDGK
jgi:hypothetical protein